MKAITTIVIVDRDEVSCYITAYLIKKTGYGGRIVCFSDTEEAAHYFLSEPLPDIVFADYYQNSWSDFSMLEQLTQQAQARQQTVKLAIFAEFYEDKAVIEARFGACTFLCKPLSPEMIERVLGGGG